jgi:hypothetical protein
MSFVHSTVMIHLFFFERHSPHAGKKDKESKDMDSKDGGGMRNDDQKNVMFSLTLVHEFCP